MDKLYVVVREDLPPGALCAQACHALRAFVDAHPEVDRAWYESSNNLVVLAARDEEHLNVLLRRAALQGVATAAFREPDFGDSLTGIAVAPAGWRMLSSLPKAFKRAGETPSSRLLCSTTPTAA